MEILNGLASGVSSVIWAVILLVIALILASVFRSLVKKILNKLLAQKVSTASAEVQNTYMSTINLVGNLVYAVVFFLFLPSALDALGMDSATQPITSTVSKFLEFVPNIIAACILIGFGSFLAKLVAQIVDSLLKKTKLDTLQEKVKIQAKPGSNFSDIVSKIVYALILVVFVVAGIQVLGISAISTPATEMVAVIFAFIPRLFAAVILLVFGIFLGNITGGLVQSILQGTGLDKFSKETYQKNNANATPASKIVGNIVIGVIDIIFVVSSVKVLGIEVLTEVGNVVIAYLPSVIAACLVLLVAWAAANWVESAIVKTYPNAKSLAIGAKVIIMVLAIFMAVSQLGISDRIIETLFTWLCIGGAVAFGLAFGLGGKDWAAKKLDKFDKDTEDQLK